MIPIINGSMGRRVAIQLDSAPEGLRLTTRRRIRQLKGVPRPEVPMSGVSSGCPICGAPSPGTTFEGCRFVTCPSCGDFAFSDRAGRELLARPDLRDLAWNHVRFAQSDEDVAFFTWKRTTRVEGRGSDFVLHFGWIARDRCKNT